MWTHDPWSAQNGSMSNEKCTPVHCWHGLHMLLTWFTLSWVDGWVLHLDFFDYRASVVLINLKYIWSNKGAVKEVISNILIIRPKSDHCLALSVSNSLLLLRLLSSSPKKVVCAPRSTRPNLSFKNLEWQIRAVIWKEKKIIQFSDVGGWLLAIYNPWGFCHQRHRIEMISFPASFISWNLLHYDFQENLPPTLFWQGDAVKPKTHSDYCYGCFWRTGQLHKLFFEGNN